MEQNSATVQSILDAFFQALARQDAGAAAELFADEIDWYVPGNDKLPWTGRRSTRSEVAPYFETMWPHFVAGESSAVPGKVVVSGDDAVVFAHFTHTAASTGRTFSTPVAMHFTVGDGAIVAMHLYEDTHAVSSAFFD